MSEIRDADHARAVAEDFLDKEVRPLLDLDVVTTDIHEYDTCWVVGYNSRAFVETGAISHALAGGGPIIVSRSTGRARQGTSALPIEQQLDQPDPHISSDEE